MDAYTVVITSCNRFDLLEATLRTLVSRLDGPLEEIVIAEDSGNPAVSDVIRNVGIQARILLNQPRLGQLASIDRAYATVKTPYIFHCEDDWEFFGENFIEPSFRLLEEFSKISMVSLRPREELNPLHRRQPDSTHDGISFVAADPQSHPEYFGYSFNPGLRRLSDYRRFGPFRDYRGEREVSYCFKQLGYYMAALQPPAVQHSGSGRHVTDPMDVIRPTRFTTKLLHSARIRTRRLKRLLLPFSDPGYQLRNGSGPFAASRIDQLDQAPAAPVRKAS